MFTLYIDNSSPAWADLTSLAYRRMNKSSSLSSSVGQLLFLFPSFLLPHSLNKVHPSKALTHHSKRQHPILNIVVGGIVERHATACPTATSEEMMPQFRMSLPNAPFVFWRKTTNIAVERAEYGESLAGDIFAVVVNASLISEVEVVRQILRH